MGAQPIGYIFNKLKEPLLSGRQDSNLRPPAPKAGAMNRATLRPEFKRVYRENHPKNLNIDFKYRAMPSKKQSFGLYYPLTFIY